MKNPWNLAKLSILGVILIIVYLPAFEWMWRQWNVSEGYYSHGLLIFIAAVYFLWLKRPQLRALTALDSSSVGFAGIGVAVILHIFAMVFRMYFLSAFSLPVMLGGIALLWGGFPVLRIIFFPLMYLYFMVPLPLVIISNLSFRMKIFAAQASTSLLTGIGIDAVLRGSTIVMPHSYLEIELPCSGLRSLISLTAFGAAFAYMATLSRIRKWILFFMAVPIALCANICRIVLLGWVSEVYGMEAAQGWVHDASGFVLFGVAVFGLAVMYIIVKPSGEEIETEER
ncbi:MAG: exosortase/archaeosortase family protein [Candidatus Omnitrophica bacterium]|nr:exosortase/archaeosortase family protein [Candidatus Omnitrophota bacterium]